jgi:4a-hydroxytetrahydrobiopterin dehydratase|tara:strand:+ start:19827 stop:20144 length:318 start_codon:yes stop_codon:yes gene_type:complete
MVLIDFIKEDIINPLDENQIEINLAELNDWKYIDHSIVKSFKTNSFTEAIGFIVMISIEAEKINHHPVIINTYNEVKIKLSTHDSSGITSKDFLLAKKIDSLFSF